MKKLIGAGIFGLLCGLTAQGKDVAEPMSGVWPQWRGPTAAGVAPDAVPPIEWSEARNVRWKTPIPGRGHSSPIVWNDRIFLTTAVATEKSTDPDTIKAVEA